MTSLRLLPNTESYIFHNIFRTKNKKCKIFRRLTGEVNEAFLKNKFFWKTSCSSFSEESCQSDQLLKYINNKSRSFALSDSTNIHKSALMRFSKFTLKSAYIWGHKWYIGFEIQKVSSVLFIKFDINWAYETLAESIYIRNAAKM